MLSYLADWGHDHDEQCQPHGQGAGKGRAHPRDQGRGSAPACVRSGAQGLSLRSVARELGMVSVGPLPLLQQQGRAADRAHYRRIRRARGDRRGGELRAARGRGPRPLAGGLHRDQELGPGKPARVRADLRLAGAGLPGAAGDRRVGHPGRARHGRHRRRRRDGGPQRGAARTGGAAAAAGVCGCRPRSSPRRSRPAWATP